MKNLLAERNRQSSGALQTNHRKYIKKPSPDSSLIYIPANINLNPNIKGTQELSSSSSPYNYGGVNQSQPQVNINQSYNGGGINGSGGNGGVHAGGANGNYISSNYRYSQKANLNSSNNSNNKIAPGKVGAGREDSFSNYELLAISHSKNFMADRRKRGKSSFYKKIVDLGNNSQAFFLGNNNPNPNNNNNNTKQISHSNNTNISRTNNSNKLTKQMSKQSKPSSPSQLQTQSYQCQQESLQLLDNEVEELHYQMVEYQQRFRKAVKN